jgi:hypothetical protein
MKRALAGEIDNLYRLPLGEFTRARNALAKDLAGAERREVASLVKPALATWVINQLYWSDEATYNALVDASEKLRTAHRAVLTGRRADTKHADQLHRATVEKAFASSIGLAEKQGVRLTDAARETVRRTLAALPGEESPGRLTRPPEPAGFSLLTGIKPRPAVQALKADPGDARAKKEAEHRARREAAALRKTQERARKEQERARKAQEKREREIRKAEQALREAERRLADLKR